MKLNFKPYRPRKPLKNPDAVGVAEVSAEPGELVLVSIKQSAEQILAHKRKLNAERQKRYRDNKKAGK
jgi:hypothetical protein